MSRLAILFFTTVMVLGFRASAEFEMKLIKRLAVFPIAEAQYGSSEDAWWQMREVLTKEQRFLVASRRFMVNRGAFQPRKQLKPADVIILGKILDAEALVVSWIEDRTMKMRVYDGQNGFLIWQEDLNFHPAISINDQLIRVSGRLIQDFMTAIPWHGSTVMNTELNRVVYQVDKRTFAKIFVGSQRKLEPGDPVQWISVKGDISSSFLNTGLKVEVVAEGEVSSQNGDQVEVLVTRQRDPEDIYENALVRFPKDLSRSKELFPGDERGSTLSAEYLSAEMKDPKDFAKDHSPTATALAFIGNLALFVVLAF